MGNQNTSGIVGEEKDVNEVAQQAQEASSPSSLKEVENQILAHEDGTKHCQERDAATDPLEDDADKTYPIESLSFCEKDDRLATEVPEDVNGSINEGMTETKRETSLNVSSKHDELKESKDLERGISKPISEIQDRASSLEGETQKIETSLELESTSSTVAISNSLLDEKEKNTLVKEIAETLDSCNTGQIEEFRQYTTCDIDDKDVEKNKDDLGVTDVDSFEGSFIEMYTDDADKSEKVTDATNIDNGILNCKDPPQEETDNSVNNHNSFLETDEIEDKHLVSKENKLGMKDIVQAEDMICLSQAQPPNQAKNQLVSCANVQKEIIQTDINRNGEEAVFSADSFLGIGLVQLEMTTEIDEKQEEDKPKEESPLENVVPREEEPYAARNSYETTLDAFPTSPSQSPSGIGFVIEHEIVENDEAVSSLKAEAETPSNLLTRQYSNNGTSKLKFVESETHANKGRHSIESNQNPTELENSPSFEFGIPFDIRSEESDQTPLLIQDRTAVRSFSNCSTLRFKSRSVQTEFYGKYEASEVEEKTIRMERSNSENARAPSLNFIKKEEKARHALNDKYQKSDSADGNQENGDKSSPSRENLDIVKGNAKRKPKSLLFGTCMCCTASHVIS